jgi:3-deoxy-D-arabino-heptulosonate 7-phosphate (DAHP) synthase
MSAHLAETAGALEHHWALNPEAAHVAADRMHPRERDQIMRITDGFSVEAVERRDAARTLFAEISAIPEGTPPPPKKAAGAGPCSGDEETAGDALFDMIEEIQDDNPDVMMYARLNGAKPRTNGKYLGALYAINPDERKAFLARVDEAFNRGIPILTEVTAAWQLGIMAPYLTGFWIGARDATGTDLRAAAAGMTFTKGIKNTLDGDPQKLLQAMQAIRHDNDPDGSGMRIPELGETSDERGISVGNLPADGSDSLTIIARGFDLPEDMPVELRRQAALGHISALCTLGVQEGVAVTIDGSHDTPKMFGIPRSNPDRFPQVMRQIFAAVAAGEIENPTAIRNMLAEVGTATGRTDKNLLVSRATTRELSELVNDFVAL